MTVPDAASSPIDLPALATELLEKAAGAPARRASRTLAHPVDGLRQTVIALLAGGDLGEHESPGPPAGAPRPCPRRGGRRRCGTLRRYDRSPSRPAAQPARRRGQRRAPECRHRRLTA